MKVNRKVGDSVNRSVVAGELMNCCDGVRDLITCSDVRDLINCCDDVGDPLNRYVCDR